MLKFSFKSLNHAIKRTQISNCHNFLCYQVSLDKFNRVSFVHSTQYSMQSSSSPELSSIIRIYEGPLGTRLKRTKLFSLTTSIVGVAGFPLVAEKIQQFPERAGWYFALLSFMSIFSFGTPALLHMMASKYILYIDYNQSKDLYTLYTYSFFLGLKPANFNASDVAVVSKPLATISVRGKGYLLEPSNFNDIEHYKRMVGYDREYDFRLDDEKNLTSSETELKRPKIPKLDHQKARDFESEKPSEEDRDLPLNLRKKKQANK